MQRIFIKRAMRDLKENIWRYLALAFLIIVGMYMVISMIAAADLIILGSEKSAEEHHLEDGQFSTFLPLTKEEEQSLTDKGITLEKMFNLDYSMNDNSVLRVFKIREQINLFVVDQGKLPEQQGEAAVEKRYAEEHDLNIGDEISLGGKRFQIVAIGSVPDYDAPLRELSDSAVDRHGFGLLFVMEEDYSALLAEHKYDKTESFIYAYRLNGAMGQDDLKELLNEFEISAEEIEDEYFREYWSRTGGKKEELTDGIEKLNDGAQELSDGLKELNEAVERLPMLPDELTSGLHDAAEAAQEFSDGTAELQTQTDELANQYFDVKLSKLTMFLKAEDNPRIAAAANDQVINKLSGLVAGVIAMALFTYVISVFVIHGIERENSVIGALYALGVKRRDLVFHYIMLPVVVTFVAGIIGALLGFSKFGMEFQASDCYDYFSIPQFESVYPPYLIVYSIIMPPIVAAVVNWIVIRRRLSRTALSLIRNEQKPSRISNANLGKLTFIPRFQIRQMLKEIRTGLTVIFGMFFSMLILMICLNCYVMCQNLKIGTERDTHFEYMYTYKYPEEEVPEGGTEAFAKSFKRENLGYNLEVTLLGITSDNPYFEAVPEKGEDRVVISSAAAQKFGLQVGDELILKDEEAGRRYAFIVTDIIQYTPAIYIFMDIDSMRTLFGESEDYFNVVFSDEKLNIPSGILLATTKREEIIRSSSVFVEMMMPMIIMLSAASAIIFCVVMYLMLKVMLDRSAFGISLIKIFGYKPKEIRRLYLDGNLFVVSIGAAISIPLAKKVMDLLFPFMVSNVACGMELTFSPQMYIGLFVAVILLYLIINRVLVTKIRKILPAEVLKNRE